MQSESVLSNKITSSSRLRHSLRQCTLCTVIWSRLRTHLTNRVDRIIVKKNKHQKIEHLHQRRTINKNIIFLSTSHTTCTMHHCIRQVASLSSILLPLAAS